MTSLSVPRTRDADPIDHDLGFDLLDSVLSHRSGAHAAPTPSRRWFWITFLVVMVGVLVVAAMQLLALNA